MSRQVRLKRIAAAVVLVGGVSCGSQDGPEFIADPSPAATVAAPGTDPTASAPASVGLERESRESTDAVPSVSVPVVSVPEVSVPVVSVPEVSVPVVSVPEVSVPSVSVPVVSVPVVSVPEVSLPVAAEYEAVYDRDDWGPHNSGLCRGAVSTPDPYTGTPIDTCNVDHVVALHEAHESGGWAWPADAKQRFSQDPQNHVASRACVNQSKGGDDIFEWSDADVASSSACGGGYKVTLAGRCLLAEITVTVKSAWSLAVDQSEADALSATLAGCGDQTPEFAAAQTITPPTTTEPTTTVAPPEECVIADKTAAEYDAVTGIGEVLSGRLVASQPFSSRAELEAVSGIGPARSEAVWSHFCGP